MTKGNGFIKESISWLVSLFVALLVALFIISNIVSMTMVMEQSMEPTFSQGDRLVVNRVSAFFSGPQRGDVIIFDKNQIQRGLLRNMLNEIKDIRNNIRFRLTGSAEKNLLIKRVIGIEGDRVEIRGGEIHINGEQLQEDYLSSKTYMRGDGEGVWEVPQGMVFVLGDNRGNSLDSRVLGFVGRDQIKGRVAFRIFPFDKFGEVE